MMLNNLFTQKKPKIGENIIFYTNDEISAWQGIRSLDSNNFFLVGTYGSSGILLISPLDAYSSSLYTINYPGASSSSIYGSHNYDDIIRLVGSYKLLNDNSVYGQIYQGLVSINEFSNEANFKTISTGGKYTYVHSTMGDLAVGNYDNPEQYGQYNLPLGPVNAFIYNIHTTKILPVVYPNATSTTVYGIWYNGNSSYTLCGGYSLDAIEITNIYMINTHTFKTTKNEEIVDLTTGKINNSTILIESAQDIEQILPIGYGFVVDYDISTNKFTNWTSFILPNNSTNIVTHFEGISGTYKSSNTYTIAADSLDRSIISPIKPVKGTWIEIKRNRLTGNFNIENIVDINYPIANSLVSSNSVSDNNIVGIVISDTGAVPYQAKIILN